MTLKRIGKITAAQGLAGDVRVKLYNPDTAWLRVGTRLALVKHETDAEPARYLTIARLSQQAEYVVARFVEVTDRTGAEALAKQFVAVYAHQLPVTASNEFYIDDLRGISVYSADTDALLGEVVDILSASAGEFLELRLAANPEVTALCPFQQPFIGAVDLSAKRLVLHGLDAFLASEAAATS